MKEAHDKRLSEDRYWHLLLHYHKGLFGGEKSDIDDTSFFLSPHGRRNASAELDATLTAFCEPVSASTEAEHPQCRYAARYAWLKSQLSFGAEMPEVPCVRFEKWKEKLKPESLSLVFASYYLNNPASMYGHTFLRLGRKGFANDRLLDYTVNFAAQTATKNGIAFAVLGLAGGYRGLFSTHPYYVKVQQYNNMESRDLWEYPLNFDDKSLDRFLLHLWEMGHTSMAYYFLNKNCSYQLLPMLEVADPSLHLKERFRFRAIPLDTLRALLAQPGLVGEPRLRASHVRLMLEARAQLSPEEVKLAESPAELPEGLSPERQALVLDSAYNYMRYKNGFYRDQPAEIQQQEQSILDRRSRLHVATTAAPGELGERRVAPPEAAHKTGRMGIAFGVDRQDSFEEISFRSAIHDLEEDPTGFNEGSQLEMFGLSARYNNQRGRATLENLNLITVKSLTARDRWVHPPSWKVGGAVTVAKDLDLDPEDSLYFGIGGGTGMTVRVPGLQHALFYAMIDLDTGVGHVFDQGYRLGAGPSGGLLINVKRVYRCHLTGAYLRYPAGNVGAANKIRLVQEFTVGKSSALRLTCDRQNHHQEAVISAQLYY